MNDTLPFKTKITHTQGVTEFEGKTLSNGMLLEFDMSPQDIADWLVEHPHNVAIIEKFPEFDVPETRMADKHTIVSELRGTDCPWVCFQSAPFGGFYMIEKEDTK